MNVDEVMNKVREIMKNPIELTEREQAMAQYIHDLEEAHLDKKHAMLMSMATLAQHICSLLRDENNWGASVVYGVGCWLEEGAERTFDEILFGTADCNPWMKKNQNIREWVKHLKPENHAVRPE